MACGYETNYHVLKKSAGQGGPATVKEQGYMYAHMHGVGGDLIQTTARVGKARNELLRFINDNTVSVIF